MSIGTTATSTFAQKALRALYNKDPHAYRELFLPRDSRNFKKQAEAIGYLATLRIAGLIIMDRAKDLILLTDKGLVEIGEVEVNKSKETK